MGNKKLRQGKTRTGRKKDTRRRFLKVEKRKTTKKIH